MKQWAVSAWAIRGWCRWDANRLVRFVLGTNRALYHKWGGNGSALVFLSLTGHEHGRHLHRGAGSGVPGEPNRLDVFVIGTDRALYHKWWHGWAWGPLLTGYERLGGVCMSPPRAVAWGPNRLVLCGY